jgi:hypothetical protein
VWGWFEGGAGCGTGECGHGCGLAAANALLYHHPAALAVTRVGRRLTEDAPGPRWVFEWWVNSTQYRQATPHSRPPACAHAHVRMCNDDVCTSATCGRGASDRRVTPASHPHAHTRPAAAQHRRAHGWPCMPRWEGAAAGSSTPSDAGVRGAGRSRVRQAPSTPVGGSARARAGVDPFGPGGPEGCCVAGERSCPCQRCIHYACRHGACQQHCVTLVVCARPRQTPHAWCAPTTPTTPA